MQFSSYFFEEMESAVQKLILNRTHKTGWLFPDDGGGMYFVTLVITHQKAARPNQEKLQDEFLSLHHALWNLYIVHSPTIALFIKLGKV